MRILGLVTAAGESTRMGGFPKPLLDFDGDRFVERILDRMAAADVDDRVVVLGHEADEVRNRAALEDATVVVNDEYESGMLSSVRLGVSRAIDGEADALLLWPVDYPCSPPAVVTRLVDRYAASDAEIVIPTHDGDRGHPALFGAETFTALRDAPREEGARAVVYDPATETVDLPSDDPRIHVDVDTPTEYWDAVKRYG